MAAWDLSVYEKVRLSIVSDKLELPLFDGQWLSHPPAFKFGGAEIA